MITQNESYKLCADLNSKGYSLREIAQKLNISHSTVKRRLKGEDTSAKVKRNDKQDRTIEAYNRLQNCRLVALELNMNYHTVRSHIAKRFGKIPRPYLTREKITDRNNLIIADYKNGLCNDDLSVKYNISRATVSTITKPYKSKDNYKKRVTKPVFQKAIKSKRISNIKNKLDTNQVGKGIAQVKPREKVYATIIRDPKDYRIVAIPDGKNTLKEVKKDDPRSDDQIIKEFLANKQKQIDNLKGTPTKTLTQ